MTYKMFLLALTFTCISCSPLHAAAPDMSLVENAFLTAGVRKGLTRNGFVDWARTRAFAEEIIAALRAKGYGVERKSAE